MSIKDDLVAPRPGLLACPFDGGLVIADPRRDRILAYNESAACVWRAIEGGSSTAKAAEDLSETFGIPLAQASADAAAIMGHWMDFGLLGASASPAPGPPLEHPASDLEIGPERVVTYRIAGQRFRTAIADRPTAQALETLLGPFVANTNGPASELTVQSGPGDLLVLRVGGAVRIRSRIRTDVVGAIFQAMLETIHGHPTWMAIVHAGAVVRNGRALVVAGPSGSGKSTLTAYLAASGFTYAADDMAGLMAPDGRLAAWPVPQSLKEGSWPVLSAVVPRLASLPIRAVGKGRIKYLPAPARAWRQEPPLVHSLLFPCYDAGAETQLRRLRPLEALQQLLGDRVWLGYPVRRAQLQAFLDWLMRTPAYAIRFDSLGAASALVDDLVG